MKCSVERLIDTLIGVELAQERKASEDRAASERRASYVVTISRGFGSLGREVGEALAARLGVNFCDRTILQEVAMRANIDLELVKILDENIKRNKSRPWKAFFRDKSYPKERYLHHLVKVILNISRKGGVILGRGGHLILGPEKAFRIRIVGSMCTCAARVAEREGIDLDAARKRVKTVNHERSKYLKKLYGQRINDCSDYDLVMNSDRFDVSQMVRLILDAMQQVGYDIPEKLLHTA